MRYKAFRIQNFKGIKDTTVRLDGIAGASVFALVGLNESGKTTILEAIHSFSPDSATRELLGGKEKSGVPFKKRVPRHLISTFTGKISVTATISLNGADKKRIAEEVRSLELEINIDHLGDEFIMERSQTFKDGDFEKDYFAIITKLQIRSKKQRAWRSPDPEEMISIRDGIYNHVPDIAYFPTFVFEFPEKAYLTDRGDDVDRFYSSVFQDILDYDGQKHTIEKDIIRRVRGDGMVTPWTTFLGMWPQHDHKAKIQHVMDRAGAAVTKLVFGRWNRIFKEDVRGKEVVINCDVVEGEVQNAQGQRTKTNEHDVYITFQVRDGTRRFNVNDRSLGFRWFFAFMLFTQFRVAGATFRPILFLFDEPASNLHSAAQHKLIESFPEIAQDEHALIYTTHSHYMIEPKWLEQTFIVTNRADAPLESTLDDISLDDESLDVRATTYRSFVNDHPTQTSYFQPILDRLEVVPSRFDMQRASVILEGRSDYYILRYAAKLLSLTEIPLLPALGAGTFGALAALHVGWNLKFLFVLDGDKQGLIEKERYSRDFGIPTDRLMTIDELVPGMQQIEDLLDDAALLTIQAGLQKTTKPNKSEIRRFFQERLASQAVTPLSERFAVQSQKLLEGIMRRLEE